MVQFHYEYTYNRVYLRVFGNLREANNLDFLYKIIPKKDGD